MKFYKLNDKLVLTLGAIGLVVASCSPAPVAAAPSDTDSKYSIVIHGVSKHSGNKVYNEVNTGAAFRYQQSESLSYQAGVYDNSYNKTTVYGIVQYTPLTLGDKVKLGGFAGLATGYDMPGIGGLMGDMSLSKRITMTVRHVLKISKSTGSVTAIELGYKF